MRRKATALFGALCLVTLAACGSDDDTATEEVTEETEAAPAEETTTEAVSLAGICPDTVTFQTDWNPESEHGFLYNMVGEGYEVDAAGVRVTGPLVEGSRHWCQDSSSRWWTSSRFQFTNIVDVPRPRNFLGLCQHRRCSTRFGRIPNNDCCGSVQHQPTDHHVGPSNVSKRESNCRP